MSPHLILRVVSKLLIPIIVVFGFYVQFHGDFGPGGGFQAGVIVAVGVILYALIFGMEEARRAVPPAAVRYLMAAGVLLFAGVGVATLLMNGAGEPVNFLDYDALHPDQSHHTGQHYGILLIELGVLFTVSSVMLAIFYAFAGRIPDLPDEDW
ncbi:Na(+)/H(+) antiporter subunit B [Maricaulis salignorans]|uniref:Multisubunit sodium/proton antiporter, MrpB subunit n=2 Tax=Maricaulis TaxID=74317 RepID=A0A1G9Q5N6_9PROT|nr:Na(+)/H(+) antiporter subunit B [Maricaulis salignorans]SDM06354.1 multisubunit sodium/proton antiporter, MrpB subunit [Maricaulis salignorans]